MSQCFFFWDMWQDCHLHLEPSTWQRLTSQRKTGTLNQMEMRPSLLIDGFTRLATQLCVWFCWGHHHAVALHAVFGIGHGALGNTLTVHQQTLTTHTIDRQWH